MDTVNTPRKTGGGIAIRDGATVQNARNGQFESGGQLTSKQAEFVREYISNGGNGAAAALAAGYNTGPQEAWRLMQTPAVIAAIRSAREKYIAGPLASKALRCLEQIMGDDGASPGARVQAAKYALDAAGHGLAAQLGAARLGLDNQDKALADMSATELEAFIMRTKANLDGLQTVSRAVTAPVIELSTS